MQKLLMLMLIMVIFMLTSSCVTTTYLNHGNKITTSIKSFGNMKDLESKTFYIESGDDNISSNDLEFREYAGYLVENLKVYGLTETTDKLNADLCFLMNYCVTDESYQENIPVPDYGRTTIASSTTKGNKTTYQYNYGTTGYHYVQANISNFVRVVNVYAYDNKSRDGDPLMLWKLNLKSKGTSDDMKKIVPYMFYIESGLLAFSDNTDDPLFYVYEDDLLFKRWKQKQIFSNPNMYTRRKGMQIMDDNIEIGVLFFVEKQKKETIVGIVKGGCQTYSIPSELYLVCDGKETKINSVEGIQLGSKIRNECGVRYIVLHFPFDLGDSNSFEIREYTDNNRHTYYKTWATVKLEK